MYSLTNLLESIAQTKATLKIVTKTKNETFFIEKWIQHHLAIIGEGKLIIFDNMSDDEHVLNIYEKYKKNIILIKFNNYPDDIHNYTLLKPFYQAISRSADFFTILDSDEYLYLYDEKANKALHDSSILEYLKKNIDCDFFAPCWLDNKKKQDNVLKLPPNILPLFGAGKPLIHTRIFSNPNLEACKTVMFRHTFELPSLQYTKAKTAFFIAHLRHLNLDQRIRTDMNKLVSLGFLNDYKDFKSLLSLPLRVADSEYKQGLIRRTKMLVKMKIMNEDYTFNETIKEKVLTIDQENRVTLSDTFSEHAFRSLMNRSYLDLINYDGTKIDSTVYPTLKSWVERE